MTAQRKQLTRKLDKLWQQAVCAAGICERCGDTPVAGHHLIGRAHSWHRHNLSNGVALCVCCHGMAHDRPEEFHRWLATYDAGRYGYWLVNRHDGGGPVPLEVMGEWGRMLREATGCTCGEINARHCPIHNETTSEVEK